ncbi:hypothetical protein ES703_68815 [subsurface metagenome]
MYQLHRKAAIGVSQLHRLLHDFLGGLAGEDNPGVKCIQKADKQRCKVIYQECPRNPDGWSGARLLVKFVEEQFFSQVEEGLPFFLGQGAIIAVAAAAVEGRLLAGQPHLGDGAVVIAPLADESSHFAFTVD